MLSPECKIFQALHLLPLGRLANDLYKAFSFEDSSEICPSKKRNKAAYLNPFDFKLNKLLLALNCRK